MRQSTIALLACCVVFASRTGGAQSDPISGTWAGDMAPNGSTHRLPITVALKLDGSGAVTGTVTGPPTPGQIKVGSFDATSGVLKLDVEVADNGAASHFLFEGIMVTGHAIGRVRGDGQTGTFKISKGTGDGVSPAGAPAGAGDASAALREGYAEVSAWVAKAAALVPADKYNYRPAPTVRTFGQLVAHVADGSDYYCGRAAGKNVQWSDATEKGATDKATVVAKLTKALAGCTAEYSGGGLAGPLTANVGHTSLHYGNIITYIRMLGLVPPST